MKQMVYKLRLALTLVLLALPVFAFGQNQTDSDLFYYTGGTDKIYLVEVPNKMFVKTRKEVSKDYLISLLQSKIDTTFQIGWITDNFCKIILDDKKIDSVIDELYKDDAILIARRVHISQSMYNYYISKNITDWENSEMCVMDDIICGYEVYSFNQELMDSIAGVYGLTLISHNEIFAVLSAYKCRDIFRIAQEIHETGLFKYAYPDPFMTAVSFYTTNVATNTADVLDITYYNLSGQKTDTPSGLTIVVEQSSDGTVRTEKKLFK